MPLTGSFVPFPTTKSAREQSSDPRLSIGERYGTRAHYEALVREAAARLVTQRYLLDGDVPTVVAIAMTNWDTLTRGSGLGGN